MKDIYIPLDFEHFLSYVFDKQTYHWYVWNTSYKSWKKTNLKLVSFLRWVIATNIHTDISHKEQLKYLLDTYEINIKNSKTFDDLNIISVKYLYKIIFEIIWNQPNNWHQKPQSRNKYLKKYREISYKQNLDQKVHIIQDEISKYTNLTSSDIQEKRFEYWMDSEKFLDWFKENYSGVYCKLF